MTLRRMYVWSGLALLTALARAGDPPSPAAVEAGPQVVEAVLAAPIADVWEAFSTPAGFKKLGVAQCEMDFRVGGLIRTHYKPAGVLGDAETIVNEILAFEPQRMLAQRIHAPPKGFPFSEDTWKRTWTVITLTELDAVRTHVRIAGMGYTESEESRKMREFFSAGNAWVLKFLASQLDAAASKPTGPAHAAAPLAPIALERTIERRREDVWQQLTSAAGWRSLCGAESRIELRPGGRFEVLLDPATPLDAQGSAGCTVLSLLPDEMLSFTWNAPPKYESAGPRATWVVLRLESPSATRTRVWIDHLGFAEAAAGGASRTEVEAARTAQRAWWERILTELARPTSEPAR
jgi:uncharacterized protein YndB with AHSA1/START domain